MPSLLAKSGSFSIANQIWRPPFSLRETFCLFAEVKWLLWGEASLSKAFHVNIAVVVVVVRKACIKENGGKFGGSFRRAASVKVPKDVRFYSSGITDQH